MKCKYSLWASKQFFTITNSCLQVAHSSSTVQPLIFTQITEGKDVKGSWRKNIPPAVGLTRDDAGLVPNSNTIFKHTHVPIIMAQRLNQEARKEDSPIKGIPFSCNSKKTTWTQTSNWSGHKSEPEAADGSGGLWAIGGQYETATS